MTDFSNELWVSSEFGAKSICGIDEAGRGPWAGPVTAAAVILDAGKIPQGLNDSKKLSAKKRDELAPQIKEMAIAWHVAFVDAETIDEINILQATFKAMREALSGLKTAADFALVDGNRDPKLGIPTKTIIKGDSLSLSIAAASILAKTARDEFMQNAHKTYPQYGFDKNAGYGVPVHIAALETYGPCPLHRKSFKPVKAILPNAVG